MDESNNIPSSTDRAAINNAEYAFRGDINVLIKKILPLLPECKCSKRLDVLQNKYDRLLTSINGYKSQVDSWKAKVETLQQDVNVHDKSWKRDQKQIRTSASKIEQFTKTNDDMKKFLKAQESHKIACHQKYIDLKAVIETMKQETSEITDVITSQKFLSEEFEKLKKDNKTFDEKITENKGNLENQITEIAQELEINIKKTTRNSQYTREECLIVTGIPENEPSGGTEDNTSPRANDNCTESKQAVIDMCKELNLIIDPAKISIAHRLKKGKFAKKGPRAIIVKFSSKELCREVYDLRRACKEIDQWAFDENAKKIYINEALTPEKRKLLYNTKQVAKNELSAKHGIIYVWTYRGDVYVRKAVDGAPKIRINSEFELKNIVNGHKSLDVAAERSSAPNMINWRYVRSPWANNNSYINSRYNNTHSHALR